MIKKVSTKRKELPSADVSMLQLALQVVNIGNEVRTLAASVQSILTAVQDYDNANIRLVNQINGYLEKINGRITDLEKAVADPDKGIKSEMMEDA